MHLNFFLHFIGLFKFTHINSLQLLTLKKLSKSNESFFSTLAAQTIAAQEQINGVLKEQE